MVLETMIGAFLGVILGNIAYWAYQMIRDEISMRRLTKKDRPNQPER